MSRQQIKRIWRIYSLSIVVVLAGCSNPQSATKPTHAEIFALRTECGKMGESWLMKHPMKENIKNGPSDAKIFYSSSSNRCWIITTYWNFSYSMYVGQSPRLWPSWSAHDVRKEVTERKRTLYDIQTGADVMTCRTLDGSGYDNDCHYIKNVEASDL